MAIPPGRNFPDIDEYKAWARITDDRDDVAIDEALLAVFEAVKARCVPAVTAGQCPDDVAYAMLLWTNRLLVRRQSPEGIAGVPDLGMITIANADADIRQMLSPWLNVVIA